MSERPLILLHAGGPKTGTSSIQRFFDSRDPSPLSQDLKDCLPFQLLLSNSSSNLSKLTHNIFSNNLGSQQSIHRDLILDQISDAGMQKVSVFSAEHAGFPFLSFVQAHRLYSFLSCLGDVKVLFYIRNAIDLSLSLYAQNIKAHGIRNTERFFDSFEKGGGALRILLCFYYLYGKDNVKSIFFERNSLYRRDVRLDFAFQLGADSLMQDLAEAALAEPSTNEKIDYQTYRILANLYRRHKILPQERQPPKRFIQFVTVGSWNGLPLCHRDFIDPAQIRRLYNLTLREISECQLIDVEIPGHVKDLDHYLVCPSRVNVRLSDYRTRITLKQLQMLKFLSRKISARSSNPLLSEKIGSYIENPESVRVEPLLADVFEASLLADQ